MTRRVRMAILTLMAALIATAMDAGFNLGRGNAPWRLALSLIAAVCIGYALVNVIINAYDALASRLQHDIERLR